MSKGSGRRPAAIPRAEADANWERTFGKKPTTLNDYVRANLAALNDKIRDEVDAQYYGRDDRRDHDRHPSIPL